MLFLYISIFNIYFDFFCLNPTDDGWSAAFDLYYTFSNPKMVENIGWRKIRTFFSILNPDFFKSYVILKKLELLTKKSQFKKWGLVCHARMTDSTVLNHRCTSFAPVALQSFLRDGLFLSSDFANELFFFILFIIIFFSSYFFLNRRGVKPYWFFPT